LDLLRQACQDATSPAVYYGNLAEMCRQQGLLEEGETAARHATRREPALAMAWNNLGIILQERGRHDESIRCLERVADIDTSNAHAHNNLGNSYARAGRLDDARACYKRALSLQPDYAEAHSNLAFVLGGLGELDAAAQAGERAIECNPRLADAYVNLIGIEIARARSGQAWRWLEAVLAFDPANPQALQARAQLLTQGGGVTAAANASPPAGAAAPASAASGRAGSDQPATLAAEAVALRAGELVQARQYTQAEQLLRANIDPRGASATLWRVLGLTLKYQGKIDAAREIQEMLAQAMPGDLSARFDLAETLLLQGEFDRGWREYRWRYSLSHTAAMERKVQRPRWDGSAIAGRTLLIHDEQGFGDTLQFVRLIRMAKARSQARVIFEVHPELLSLASRVQGADLVIARGQIPPPFDVHCELMSLPAALTLQLHSLPGQRGYLLPDAARVAKWRKRLHGLPRPWVALAWAGRPTHTNDANRSLHLHDLGGLALPGITFLAIQKGPAALQAATPPAGMRIVPLDAEIADFEDTAAILALADLLVSVDSSPVHLAGAMNRPSWVMLPFLPDWRWLLGRDDTPWYSSMRLFRQVEPGAWRPVLEAIAKALSRRFGL